MCDFSIVFSLLWSVCFIKCVSLILLSIAARQMTLALSSFNMASIYYRMYSLQSQGTRGQLIWLLPPPTPSRSSTNQVSNGHTEHFSGLDPLVFKGVAKEIIGCFLRGANKMTIDKVHVSMMGIQEVRVGSCWWDSREIFGRRLRPYPRPHTVRSDWVVHVWAVPFRRL